MDSQGAGLSQRRPAWWNAELPELAGTRQPMPAVERWQTAYVRYHRAGEANVSQGGWSAHTSRQNVDLIARSGLEPPNPDPESPQGMIFSPLAPETATIRIIEAPASFALPVKQDRRFSPSFRVRVDVQFREQMQMAVTVRAHVVSQHEKDTILGWAVPGEHVLQEVKPVTELKGTTSITHHFEACVDSGPNPTPRVLRSSGPSGKSGPSPSGGSTLTAYSGAHGLGGGGGSGSAWGSDAPDGPFMDGLDPLAGLGMLMPANVEGYSMAPGGFLAAGGGAAAGSAGSGLLYRGSSGGQLYRASSGSGGSNGSSGDGRMSGNGGYPGVPVDVKAEMAAGGMGGGGGPLSADLGPLTTTSHDFDFESLEFLKPSRLKRVYLLFACTIMDLDTLFVVYNIPTVSICRAEQRDKACVKLGLPSNAHLAVQRVVTGLSAYDRVLPSLHHAPLLPEQHRMMYGGPPPSAALLQQQHQHQQHQQQLLLQQQQQQQQQMLIQQQQQQAVQQAMMMQRDAAAAAPVLALPAGGLRREEDSLDALALETMDIEGLDTSALDTNTLEGLFNSVDVDPSKPLPPGKRWHGNEMTDLEDLTPFAWNSPSLDDLMMPRHVAAHGGGVPPGGGGGGGGGGMGMMAGMASLGSWGQQMDQKQEAHGSAVGGGGGGVPLSRLALREWILEEYDGTGLRRRLTQQDLAALLSQAGFPSDASSQHATISQAQCDEFASQLRTVFAMLRQISSVWNVEDPVVISGFDMDRIGTVQALRMEPAGTFLCRFSMSQPGCLVLSCRVMAGHARADGDGLLHAIIRLDDLQERRVDAWIRDFVGATHLLDVYRQRRVDKRKVFASQYSRLVSHMPVPGTLADGVVSPTHSGPVGSPIMD